MCLTLCKAPSERRNSPTPACRGVIGYSVFLLLLRFHTLSCDCRRTVTLLLRHQHLVPIFLFDSAVMSFQIYIYFLPNKRSMYLVYKIVYFWLSTDKIYISKLFIFLHRVSLKCDRNWATFFQFSDTFAIIWILIIIDACTLSHDAIIIEVSLAGLCDYWKVVSLSAGNGFLTTN